MVVYRVRHIPTGKYFGAWNDLYERGKVYNSISPAKAFRTRLTNPRYGWQAQYKSNEVEVVEFMLWETTGRYGKPCLNPLAASKGVTCGGWCTSEMCQAEPT